MSQYDYVVIGAGSAGYNSGVSSTGLVALNHPQSIGNVRLRSPNPADAPMIQMNYLKAQSDVKKLIEGVQLLRQLFQSSEFDDFCDREVAPETNMTTEAALEDYIRETSGTVFHPSGTCKIGTDQSSVVDSALRVYGLQGLRVVDASIMPRIITGHTNAPIIMIGKKAADLIKTTNGFSSPIFETLAN